MGISFGKRKVKIKLLGQTEAVKEEEKQSEPVQTYRQEIIVSNPKPKVNRTFKEALKEIAEQSKNSIYQTLRYISITILTADINSARSQAILLSAK